MILLSTSNNLKRRWCVISMQRRERIGFRARGNHIFGIAQDAVKGLTTIRHAGRINLKENLYTK